MARPMGVRATATMTASGMGRPPGRRTGEPSPPGETIVTEAPRPVQPPRALGAELADPGQSIFWGPIVVFGGIWFAATVAAHRRRAAVTHQD
jgi:hypothetical protein